MTHIYALFVLFVDVVIKIYIFVGMVLFVFVEKIHLPPLKNYQPFLFVRFFAILSVVRLNVFILIMSIIVYS